MSLSIFKMSTALADVMPPEYRDLVESGPYGAGYGVSDLGSFKEVVEEHPLCAGCCLSLSVRMILASLPQPEDTLIVGSTGCSSLVFPQVAIQNIHSLFGNQNAVATGLKRALRLRFPDKPKDVVVIAGDGATADIGLDMVMHSWSRREHITTIMLDNEAYANTGGQESGMSQESAVLYMAPTGKKFPKLALPEIARETGCAYAGTCSPNKPKILERSIRRAILVAREIGPSYVQVFCPCPTNYKFKPDEGVKRMKSREKDGTYPAKEFITPEALAFLRQHEGKKTK